MNYTEAFGKLGYKLSSPRTDWSAEGPRGVCLSIWGKEMRKIQGGLTFDTRLDAQPIEGWNHKQGFKRRQPHLQRIWDTATRELDVVVVSGTPGESYESADPWVPEQRRGLRWVLVDYDAATGHFVVATRPSGASGEV